VKSISVATGGYSYDDLLKYEPDYVFNDFSDTQKVIDAILN
jgi:phosphoglycolate phosphatase-like HAD superfamily hydrolase